MSHIFHITKHAEERASQRGLRPDDIELLIRHAVEVSGDGYLMTNSECKSAIADINRNIDKLQIMCRKLDGVDRKQMEGKIRRLAMERDRLENLRGVKIVIKGDHLVTLYRSSRIDQRRCLKRDSRRRNGHTSRSRSRRRNHYLANS